MDTSLTKGPRRLYGEGDLDPFHLRDGCGPAALAKGGKAGGKKREKAK